MSIDIICPSCNALRENDPDITERKCYNCGDKMVPKKEYEKERREAGDPSRSMGGYIYVLVSSEKPNLVKIGMTEREPEERARELSSSTGVSMPYIVAYQAEVENPSAVESSVHEQLSESRVNPNREFFRVKTREAIRVIEEAI